MCGSLEEKFLNHGVPVTTEVFDEKLFELVCDAHCHPHDDKDNLALIPQLKTGHVTIMGVRQDDWETVSKVAKACNEKNEGKCVPSFGIHPWFSHFLMTEKEDNVQEHYKEILQSSNEQELQALREALEKKPVFSYDTWYSSLRKTLLDHPGAMVGEVGIDGSARLLPGGSIDWHGVKPTSVKCSEQHQINIFDIQCQLARELDRSISVHLVQGHGPLFKYLQTKSLMFSNRKLKMMKVKPNILRICLHSYGGSPASVKQFMDLKGYEMYISFSVCINARLTPAKKLQELIRAVPEDRLLIESDLDTPTGIDKCMIEIIKIVAEARQWSISKVVETTHQNWLKFTLR